ncbi:perlucin-like protein [Stylophora pistillata]|uniref:perlucin-like protein n=1 Tax=Stylophora pistillata TaxID=50429 RepID=UPI000C04FECB|nr:perlucin-like protein [Stylophora pistillata]XP_022795999.1 perlucin-like protein [Stylophora pistillata]
MKSSVPLPVYILTLLATSCFVSGSSLKRKEDPMEKETEFVKPMKGSSLNRNEDPIEKETEFVKPVMASSLKRKADPMEKETEIVKPMMDEFAEELLKTLENIEEVVDPCPADWSHFSEYCYHASSSPRNQREARSFCQSLGGDLVKITSAEENEFVLYLARKFAGNGKPTWIGLFWHPESVAYYWTDRSVPTYTNWAPDEPNGFAKEPCVEMYTGSTRLPFKANGYWNDVPCTPKYNTVCKKLA